MFVKESSEIEKAFRFCREIAFRHYENFPVASTFVPRRKRKYIAAIYAFARTADDVADENGCPKDLRLEKLSELQRKLRESQEGLAREPLFVALDATIRRFGMPIEDFENLLTAFRMDVEKKRYVTWEELLKYCSFSANPIGRLILRLFNYDGQEGLHACDAICTALQLTNFWQDLSIDVKRDRIYLPLEDLNTFHCTENDILSLKAHENFRQLMAYEVGRTAALFEEGKTLWTSVGRDLRFQLKLTWFAGMRVLEKIRRSSYDVFHHRPSISFWDKCFLLMKAAGIGAKDTNYSSLI
mgnify:CR=1 FL=1